MSRISPAAAGRLLRAVPFAVVCTVVSALGHAHSGGGDVPALSLLAGGLAVLASAGWGQVHTRSAPVQALGLLGGQLGLHLLFHLTCRPAAAMTSMPGMAAMPGLPAGTSPAQPGLWGLTPAMVMGHLLAAVVAGWWLHRGEAACRRLLTMALAPLRVALTLFLGWAPAPSCGPVRPGRGDNHSRPPPTAVLLRHQLIRRGPPALLPA